MSHRLSKICFFLLTIAFTAILASCDNEPPTETSVPVATATMTSVPTPTLQATPTTASTDPATTQEANIGALATSESSDSPTIAPLPTLPPSERLAAASQYFVVQNYDAVIGVLAPGFEDELPEADRAAARLILARAYLATGRFTQAIDHLNQLHAATVIASPNAPSSSSEHNAQSYFYLAEALIASQQPTAAIEAYQQYLNENPEMGAYVWPRIGAAHQQLNAADAYVTALEEAIRVPAHRIIAVDNRQRLAESYMGTGRYTEAADIFLEITTIAQTEQTRGSAYYQAGQAAIFAGDSETGYDHYLTAVNQYPRAYDAYRGLVALVEADIEVDEFQRGLVDFYAGAYEPAIAAFERYVISNTVTVSDTVTFTYRPDAHLYIAYSYESLGNLNAAVAEIQTFAAIAPDDPARAADAQLEEAQLYFRMSQWALSRAAYVSYVEQFPDSENAGSAAWWAARLTELAPDAELAVERYLTLLNAYPTDENAARAGFRAGYLQASLGRNDEAAETWRTVIDGYPDSSYAAASWIWLSREEGEAIADDWAEPAGYSYYHLRAADLNNSVESFKQTTLNFEADAEVQQAADAWLRERLGLAPDDPVSTLSPILAADTRLVRGQKLWELGLLTEAKWELEAVRVAYQNDPAATYQLAIFFRDLGLYRSSILAANRLMFLTDTNVFTAPRFIGQLSYPAYFTELLLPLSTNYGYDPALQLALIRQESLFESFIASPVGAQGLSQIMPATGDYIATQLGWSGFQTADLTQPHLSLTFGAFYIDQQLNAFDGTIHAALAAYNAGPGNAARWYAESGTDLDLFVEVINFPETRTYIEKIYVGHLIYRMLYADEVVRNE